MMANDDKSADLKPCPFCKWPAHLVAGSDEPFWVECIDCCAQGAPEATIGDAIAAWNTRAPASMTDTDQPTTNAALADELEDAAKPLLRAVEYATALDLAEKGLGRAKNSCKDFLLTSELGRLASTIELSLAALRAPAQVEGEAAELIAGP